MNIDLNNAELSDFTETFMSLFDKHAPKKQKYIRRIMLTLWQKFKEGNHVKIEI